MKKYLCKLWARILYALGVIDKKTLKARTKIVNADDDPHPGYGQFVQAFLCKFDRRLTPGQWPFDVNRVDVGVGTYGTLNVLISNVGKEMLTIGNFCSIAPDVMFILQSEHPYKGVSTYPFKVMLDFYKYEATSKGDITVGDDVWLGHGATICSGVKIGQGAIVAAGSIVVKDVPPYAIVGGNPAKFIKWRFEDEAVRERLMRLDWSKFNKAAVNQDNIEELYAPITLDNVDAIEAKFFFK